jgi:hypothetical protein
MAMATAHHVFGEVTASRGLPAVPWTGPVIAGCNVTAKVRKTPSWPRSWANFSLL